MSFEPSKYQKEVFSWMESAKPGSSLVVMAGPGTGKTTTLTQASLKIDNPKDAIFVAFNKHIAEELSLKLPRGMQARTLHSLGFEAVREAATMSGRRPPKIDGYLHGKLAKEWLTENNYKLDLERERWFEVLSEIKELINLCQLCLIDPYDEDAVWDGIDHYGLEIRTLEPAIDGVRDVLNRIKRESKKVISYNEMIWLPIIDNLPIKKYGAVLADESQDFNFLQQTFVKKLRKQNGYSVFIGDAHQAIYGFAFASTNGMRELATDTRADILPLSICYRCPTSHVALANDIYPGLEARPGAPDGDERHVYDFDVSEIIQPGDLVICRVNAPLIPLCFSLIKDGINAQIKGRDIGKQLIKDLKAIDKKHYIDWLNPKEAFKAYLNAQAAIISGLFDEDEAAAKIERLTDKIDCLGAIWDGSQCDSVGCMERTIENLFSDKEATIWLSTIHKAKGLEADNVFILKPSVMPHPMAKRSWEKVQEANMKYIALTRAMETLYFCWEEDEDGRPADEEMYRPDGLDSHHEGVTISVQAEVVTEQLPLLTA